MYIGIEYRLVNTVCVYSVCVCVIHDILWTVQ